MKPLLLRHFGWRSLVSCAVALPGAVRAQALDPAAATRHYLESLPAAARARSDAYFEGGYWLLLWDLVVALAIAWWMLRSRWSARLRERAERITHRPFLQALLHALGYVIVTAGLTLPWSFYEGFVREHQYALSNLTATSWLGEELTGLVVTLVLLPPLVALGFLAIRRWPERWWLGVAAATPVLLTVLLVIQPVFIAPLFNTYRPLAEGPAREAVLTLARANGVPVNQLVQFDASRQSNRISANVSGAFGTVRIALNDNLLNRCSPAEIKAVMAHELGHYVLNHTARLIVYLSLVIAAGLAFTAGAVRRLASGPAAARWGLRGPADPAALPLYIAVLTFALFVATPVTNTIVRTAEIEADLFGLNAAREPDGFAAVALKVANYRKLAPGPIEETLFYDHPSGYQRIYAAMRWKAAMVPDPAAQPR
jgi:STE24 endopeptidase